MITLADAENLNDELYVRSAIRVLSDSLRMMVPASPRPILDWCEDNFTYPSGPKASLPYRREDQPATAKFLELLEDTYWRRAMLVAPNQVGKSLSLWQYVFHVLFNLREDLIIGMPNIDQMWKVKYNKDFLPALRASKFHSQMPDKGPGSDGGTPSVIIFKHGHSMVTMGAGAGDSQRAGSTARVVAITELKDFGEVAAGSDEGTKLDQLINRTKATMGREIIFGESTVTTLKNIAWKWYLNGTQSQPYMPCECCEEFIAPEREHLIGWQHARTEEEAREKARFSCPQCGIVMDEPKRKQLLQQCVVLHRGQTMDRGKVLGDLPPTRNLSYRFSAAMNMMADAGSIGVEEWNHMHETEQREKITKNRALMQGVWGMPTSDDDLLIDKLNENVLSKRAIAPEFGIVPEDRNMLWGGVDVRKTALHWAVIASGVDVGPREIAWGEQRLLQDIPFEEALKIGVTALQDRFRNGFAMENGKTYVPVTLTLIDCRWKTPLIQALCDQDDFWLPVMGFGAGILAKKKYITPSRKSATVKFIGDAFDVKLMDETWVIHSDASEWKSRLHESLRADVKSDSGLTFSLSEPRLLRLLTQHLTAEHEVVSQQGGQSSSIWIEDSEHNHLLDATSYSNLARFVWKFLEEFLFSQEPEDDGYVVTGNGSLFG